VCRKVAANNLAHMAMLSGGTMVGPINSGPQNEVDEDLPLTPEGLTAAKAPPASGVAEVKGTVATIKDTGRRKRLRLGEKP